MVTSERRHQEHLRVSTEGSQSEDTTLRSDWPETGRSSFDLLTFEEALSRKRHSKQLNAEVKHGGERAGSEPRSPEVRPTSCWF